MLKLAGVLFMASGIGLLSQLYAEPIGRLVADLIYYWRG